MKSKSSIPKLAVMALPVALAAVAIDARAQERVGIDVPVQYTVSDPADAIGTFVGMPVRDEGGAFYGVVSEVVVDGAQASAIVRRGDGSLAEVPLGNTDDVLARLPAAQPVMEIEPVLIVPEYRTPESRGS